ncbi:hypothetical protein [Desulfotruncus arcticus]|uniref:hypothetical protein n=1 Tax=Desulfotruncus arcticus TaxID=341036 RepID=UPI000B8860B6|nr:hypothetical protein [Desulfotruncus arcticus]
MENRYRRQGDPVVPGVSEALDAASSPSNPSSLTPKGRKVTPGCLLQALCTNNYTSKKENCAAHGGNHRSARYK